MSPAVTDVRNRSQHAGNIWPLPDTLYLGSTTSRIPVMRVAFARRGHGQRRIGDPRVFQYQCEQRAFIDMKNLISVSKALPNADLFYRKFCKFKFHCLLFPPFERLERFELFLF